MKRLVLVLELALLLGVLSPLGAGAASLSAEAKAHFEKGTEAYDAEDWPTAIRELKAAYLIRERPEYLFALAQAYRRSGDCESAITSYQAFLRSSPNRSSARIDELIEECEAELERVRDEKQRAREEAEEKARRDAQRAVQRLAARSMTVRPAKKALPSETTRVVRWYQDPLGDTLAIAALGAVGAGATFLVLGNTAMERAGSAGTYGEYQTASLAAKPQQLIGLSALGAGLLLAVGATWRYLIIPSMPLVSVAAHPAGAFVAVSGSF
jgi:tetratricopeptide (TPR) repeat protein